LDRAADLARSGSIEEARVRVADVIGHIELMCIESGAWTNEEGAALEEAFAQFEKLNSAITGEKDVLLPAINQIKQCVERLRGHEDH